MDEYDGGSVPAITMVVGSAPGFGITVVVNVISLISLSWQQEHQYLYMCCMHSMTELIQQQTKMAPTSDPMAMAAMNPPLRRRGPETQTKH